MKTIDVLILEELADHPCVTANDISQTWGEDRTRCWEWLEKFRKSGLCYHDGMSIKNLSQGVSRITYTGYPEKIGEYLRSRSGVKS